jgi:hypothetical protein
LAGVVYQMIKNVALMTGTDSVLTNTLCSVAPFAVILTAALASRTARGRRHGARASASPTEPTAPASTLAD